MEIDIQIDNDIYLTKTSRQDKDALIEYLNDDELFNQTLRVPKPYTDLDAENWFNYILTFFLIPKWLPACGFLRFLGVYPFLSKFHPVYNR